MAIVTEQAWSDSLWTSLRHFWVLWEKNTDKKDQPKAKLDTGHVQKKQNLKLSREQLYHPPARCNGKCRQRTSVCQRCLICFRGMFDTEQLRVGCAKGLADSTCQTAPESAETVQGLTLLKCQLLSVASVAPEPCLWVLIIDPHAFQTTLVSPALRFAPMAQRSITAMLACISIWEAVAIGKIWP